MNISNSVLEQPLLSILIPTKNRQHTAIACIIEAAKAGSASEVQIVIQDCSDDDSLRSILVKYDLFERVVYQYVDYPVSMADNWNLGMRHIRGEYVIIVGDDDTVLPGIVYIAHWASKLGYSAVKPKQIPLYFWPDFPDKLNAGKFQLRYFTGKIEIVKIKSLLKFSNITGVEFGAFPQIYRGIIKHSVLEQIYNKTGRYFDSLSPDVYCSYSVALAVEEGAVLAVIDYPFVIEGKSLKSNSAARLKSGESQKHNCEYNNYQLSPIAPSDSELCAILADCMALALIHHDRKDMLMQVNLEKIFARTIVVEPHRISEHVKKFVNAVRYLERNVPLAIFKLFGNIISKLILNLMHSLHKPIDRSVIQHLSNIESIAVAVDIQVEWLTKNCPLFLQDIKNKIVL